MAGLASVSDKNPFLCWRMPTMSTETERNGVNVASAQGGGVGSLRQPVQRSCQFANRSLALALGLGSQKDIRVTLAEALLLVWLEQPGRGNTESGRQKINGEDESPACIESFLFSCADVISLNLQAYKLSDFSSFSTLIFFFFNLKRQLLSETTQLGCI